MTVRRLTAAEYGCQPTVRRLPTGCQPATSRLTARRCCINMLRYVLQSGITVIMEQVMQSRRIYLIAGQPRAAYCTTVDPQCFVLVGMKRSVHEILNARNIGGSNFLVRFSPEMPLHALLYRIIMWSGSQAYTAKLEIAVGLWTGKFTMFVHATFLYDWYT